jgi:hypothetical protein
MKLGERIRQNAEYVQHFLDFTEYRTIAELFQLGMGGLSTTTARQALKHLCQLDKLEVRTRGVGDHTANEYRLLPQRIDND